ncbi:phosphate ABC transporter substrate-binding protein PstS [Variovorax sp. J22R24]|uniref:phosphate ABC transporter substrate-binding protein PstS n=1 Tax=Variovorax gracilis TaxID=3053502 RepID=UPI00257675A8|nr:phosphate ABC transporter substrate-binding protein PstS [Variovorax sp. J22R24]MDM0109989.1 phosphate ABC transporter substrate-binding protein PstS [Variovorax sp. J22R24]
MRCSLATLGLAALAFAQVVTARAQDITGAGASFPAPLYTKWASEFKEATGVNVTYQSVGSGAGLQQIEAKTVDFGASDMPLTDEELRAKGLLQFPTVIGGVVPVVNIPFIKPGELKLSGQVLGDIYLGRITRWNDPAIKGLNGSLGLPDAPIALVRRADSSGTTFLFTHYLSKVNPQWKAKVGDGMVVNWPSGAGGKGNEGVATFVSRLPNSIGYIEYAFVKQNRMAYVKLQNRAGHFVSPSNHAFEAAASDAEWSESFHRVLTDAPGQDAWPITGATFIVMNKSPDRPVQAATTLKFFDWAYREGDRTASKLDYVPMPGKVKSAIVHAWGEVRDTSGNVIRPN